MTRGDWVIKHLEWANERLRRYCGPNFWFEFRKGEDRFELWEQRGPLRQMIFPVTAGGVPLPKITDWELEHATKFVRRRRQNGDEDFYKYKEYKKFTNPDEYVNPHKEDDPNDWVDTSPKVKGYTKRKVYAKQ